MRQIWTNARDLRKQGTDAERMLWKSLRGKQVDGLKFRRQYPVAGFIADFACVEIRLIVELDGGQHLLQADYDQRRSEKLMQAGYRVIRFWNDQVLVETDAVLAEIFRHASTPPQPSPASRGGGQMPQMELPSATHPRATDE